MQFLLNMVEIWCTKWRLEVNLTKTNVMHVRGKGCKKSSFLFVFNKKPVEYCSQYRYLGVTLNEFLDYNLTANIQAEPAGRALGSVITKTIKNGGLPYNIFSMLFECCCASVSDYGSEIWGFEPKDGITKIHLRAARSFLGLPKNTTSVGILTEINWMEPVFRAQIRMVRQFCRVLDMENDRLTNKIVDWDRKISQQFNFQTWYTEIKTIFENHNLLTFFDQERSNQKYIIDNLKQSMLIKQSVELQAKCQQMPKLRTFCSFKDFGTTPAYLLMPISFVQKKFLAKIRVSALHIRIETGRYERPKLMAHERLCPCCKDNQSIENEEHFIFYCKKYSFLRQIWLSKLQKPEIFSTLEICEKFKIIFNQSANIKITAQFIIDCYDLRSKIVYS